MLTPVPNQELPKIPGSRIKVSFNCSCGNLTKVCWRNFTSHPNMTCGHIIAYSDNRFGSGKIYESIGFYKDCDVKSDFYPIKGPKRLPRNEVRDIDKCRKIWYLGQVKWVWNINSKD